MKSTTGAKDALCGRGDPRGTSRDHAAHFNVRIMVGIAVRRSI
jgi:hypothetical protein